MGKLANYDFLKGNSYSLVYSNDEFLELYNQGLNDTEISRIIGCNHVTIHKKREKLGLKPNFKYKSKIDIEKFKILHSQGKNDREIAEHFDLNSRWIGDKRRELKLPKNYDLNINRTEGSLSYDEEQVLIGTVLGDTYLRKEFENGGTGGMFAHSLKQKQYALWKGSVLKRFVSRITERSQFHKVAKKTYFNIQIHFKTDTILNKYHKLFYNNKKKVIYQELLNILEPLGLAVWFMDDGMKGTKGGYYLCTNCFSENEINLIIGYFKQKWNLDCSIHRNLDNLRLLYIKKNSAISFKNLIKNHIHEELKYKLHD